jgi:drug/metabolite transporter (DMT)-like permease
MGIQKIAAIALIVAGVLGLVYRGFSYTSETHKADVGPIHMTVDEKERVDVPVWAGIGALVVGVALLVWRSKS